MNGWVIDEVVGRAGDFHAWEPGPLPPRTARWFHVAEPAVVLGSAQSAAVIDDEAAQMGRIDVVRRRSGGGAVLMLPGDILWLDVVVPVGDPLWSDDVGRAMWWLGEVWAAALQDLAEGTGAEPPLVHRGALVTGRWSRLVCFDGLGPGEVVVADAKAVGISQRRTRNWARLQSAVHLHWRPEVLIGVLREPRPLLGDLRPVHEVAADPAAVVAAVTARLVSRD